MPRIDKLSIADELIEAAIEEFIDQKRYFSAFNLAGVAEELYGKYVRINGGQDVQMETIQVAGKLGKLQYGLEFEIKEWKKTANYLKNSVKHFDSESDRYLEIDTTNEARLMIGDALSNHAKLERDVTPTIQRFYDFGREWVSSHVSDEKS
jgi:hypothetical protein